MIDKRVILAVTLAVALLVPLVGASAQPVGRVPRIGIVGTSPSIYSEAFTQALSELGYVEGRSAEIERRYSGGRPERFPELVADLVSRRIDVMLVVSEPAVRAAKQATATIPIVMLVASDPVEAGLVASFARPGGNITGFSTFQPDLVGKRLQLLRELVPRLSRVAVLGHAADPAVARAFKEVEKAAAGLQLTVQTLKVTEPSELDGSFTEIVRARSGGLLVLQNSWMWVNRGKVTELAARSRVPAVYGLRDYVAVGGLVSYSNDYREEFVRAATYVDKILKGVKPDDLPVQQPTKFELVINLKTAKALSLTVPPSLLQRADQIVQ